MLENDLKQKKEANSEPAAKVRTHPQFPWIQQAIKAHTEPLQSVSTYRNPATSSTLIVVRSQGTEDIKQLFDKNGTLLMTIRGDEITLAEGPQESPGARCKDDVAMAAPRLLGLDI